MSKKHSSPSVEPSDGVAKDGYSSSSSYNSSDNSKKASASSSANQESSESRSRLRKRKHRSQSLTSFPSRRKRLKPFYNDEYRQLFNKTVLNVAHGDSIAKGSRFEQSQLGVTTWSPSEKAIFFRKLACKGRDDLPSIAVAIGTKSELEVQAYLLLLDEASTSQQIYAPYESLLDQSEVPAATEVSQECETALENAADALALLQQKEDEKAEKKQYGEQWRLTSKIAKGTHERPHDDPDSEVEVAETVPAANLLDLKNFLTLMTRCFMNSTNPEYNYRTYAVGRDERPSIFHTAFFDFHTLVVSLTRRLVQCALLLAMSRLRAIDQSKQNPRRHVKRSDVVAALGVLGMKADTHDYWVRLARRCRLNVHETHSSDHRRWNSLGERLDYNAVENALDQGRNQTGQYARTPLEVSSRATTPLDNEKHPSVSSDTASEYAASDSKTGDAPSSSDDIPLDHRSPDTLQTEDLRDQEEDAYVSALDHQASLREEKRLWECLGREPPEPIHPKDVDLPMKPAAEPKPLADIDDWRRCVRYAAEWEVQEPQISKNDFARNREKYASGAALIPARHKSGFSAAEHSSEDEAGDRMLSTSDGSPESDFDKDMEEGNHASGRGSIERASPGFHDAGQEDDGVYTSESDSEAPSEEPRN